MKTLKVENPCQIARLSVNPWDPDKSEAFLGESSLWIWAAIPGHQTAAGVRQTRSATRTRHGGDWTWRNQPCVHRGCSSAL